jgi:hypothetical protein
MGLGETFLCLDILLIIRLALVYRIRSGALDLINTMASFEIDRGDFRSWERRLHDYNKTDLLCQCFDLLKWRAYDFFPELYKRSEEF